MESLSLLYKPFFRPVFTNAASRWFLFLSVTKSEPGLWKWFFFCGRGSGSAKILPLPLPYRLFDLRVTWKKSFVHFPMWIKR